MGFDSKVSDGKRAVLEATGRLEEPVGADAVTAAEVIDRLKANLRKAAGMTP